MVAFKSVYKQQVSGMEDLADGICAMCCACSSLAVPLLCGYRLTQKDNGTSTVCAKTIVGDVHGNEFVHDTNTWYD